jgi:ABC-type multidrug transport system fused ATPase/permease subunit
LHSGEILIDGHNIEHIKSKSLYQQVGVAIQEPYLWDETIETNIKYGKEDARLNEIYKAAQIACIDDFVNSLPEKYNTVIGENACKISEGQKQRIAIARAVIRRPKILILDEALSSVDIETEEKIISNIKAELYNTTLIVISHHLSTIKKMNLVYFLDGYDKINIDTHKGLIDKSLRYQNYLAHQLK